MNREEAEQVLNCAMAVGERMLINGAEVGRVEEAIRRVCTSYGAARVDVFSITSSVITTLFYDEEHSCTQTRRVTASHNDLDALGRLDALSRKICTHSLSFEEVRAELKRIDGGHYYSFPAQMLAYAIVSGSFSIFFGGDILDMFASAIIGVLLRCFEPVTQRVSANRLVSSLLCAVFGGLLSNFAVLLGIGHHADLISIGNIMLLIPGIAFTNSLRDMFAGDIITGLIRFCESILLAVTIALGFAFANSLF